MVGYRRFRDQWKSGEVVRAEITFNGDGTAASRYVGWAPVPAQVRLSDPTDATGPVTVSLQNQSTTQGGQVVFFSAIPGTAQDDLELHPAACRYAGAVLSRRQVPAAQHCRRDANVQIVNTANNQAIGTTSLMVRVRKNANSLTTAERNRLLAAFATLNNAGMGRFADFRNVHSSAGDPEAHQNAGFPPWHRAFLLDLERELQQIDPSVALPYWRFDEPAPNLFTRDFMGVTDPALAEFCSAPRTRFSSGRPMG